MKHSKNMVLTQKVGFGRALYRFLKDPNASSLSKVVMILWPIYAPVYAAWPLDVISDLIPFVGLVDDATIVAMAPVIAAKAWSIYKNRRAAVESDRNTTVSDES